MAERDETTGHDRMAGTTAPARRTPDLLCLLAGLVSLGIAGSGFAGHAPDLPDLRWVLAAAAIALGLVLLAASVRRRT